MIADSPLAEAFWKHGRLDDCPVYDMHGHMGPWPAIYFPRSEPEEMLRSMDTAGVRTLVFSSHEALFSASSWPCSHCGPHQCGAVHPAPR